MTAFNVVRFRVKPGEEERFVEAHRAMKPQFRGFVGGALVKTGERSFCMVGEWKSFQSIVDARPQMIPLLDGVRGMLEDLGGGLGVTDPVSGEAVLKLGPWTAKKKRPARARPRKKRAKGGRSRR